MTFTQHSYEQIQKKLDIIWLQCGGLVQGRVEVFRRAALAMDRGRFNAAVEHQCLEESHALLGELGTFGFSEASRITLTIDQLLKDTQRRSRHDAAVFLGLISLLAAELDRITPGSSANTLMQ